MVDVTKSNQARFRSETADPGKNEAMKMFCRADRKYELSFVWANCVVTLNSCESHSRMYILQRCLQAHTVEKITCKSVIVEDKTGEKGT